MVLLEATFREANGFIANKASCETDELGGRIVVGRDAELDDDPNDGGFGFLRGFALVDSGRCR